MQTKKDFKYSVLFDEKSGKYCTDASVGGLVMGPETKKRFDENTDDCAVTICCITYKHEEFIRSALDGFLMQKTNFKFKVFVGEDCGPDGTADIVREYAEKYPDIIVPFIREKNMGAQANLIDLCNHAHSPYIAFCEGDDYWVDEYKLQKQYDLMQQNPDWRICYSRAKIEAPDDWFLRDWFKADKKGELIFPDCEPTYKVKTRPLTAQDCVWVFPAHTATVFYRWNYDVKIPDWYYTGIIGDHPIFMMQLGNGSAGFLQDITAVYRRSNVGVFMSDDMDEHFMRTRIDHVRWMSGLLDWYKDNLDEYPEVSLKNRIKHESFNFLRTAINNNLYDEVLRYFNKYPEAAKMSLNAYLVFYAQGKTLINAATWPGYKLMVDKKRYRLALRLYGYLCRGAEACKDGIKAAVKAVARAAYGASYWMYCLVPKKKTNWVITGFRGGNYMDNSKYFYEYILEHFPEIKITWLTKEQEIFDMLSKEGRPVAKMNTRKGRKALARAGVIITDHNVMSDYYGVLGLNHRAKVVQLWHGVGFKAMGDGKNVKLVSERGVVYSDDILVKKGDGLFKKLKKCIKFIFCAPHRELFEKYFMLVCPGTERVEMIGRIWNIPDESMFMAGHPRDILSYSLSPDKSSPKIMFAPTFRYDPQKEMELIDNCVASFDKIEALMESINGMFYVRLHPHTWRNYQSRIKSVLSRYKHIVLDTEKDVYTSLGTYNIVITDYSSISLDFALLGRPAIYFCPDFDWFSEKQAGFNLDFKNSIPGPMVDNWDDVLNCIKEYIDDPSKDEDFRKQKLKYFFDLEVNGPDNSKRIVEEIKRRLEI